MSRDHSVLDRLRLEDRVSFPGTYNDYTNYMYWLPQYFRFSRHIGVYLFLLLIYLV